MATRSKSLVEDEERELESDIGDLVTKGSLFAVRAENAFTNFFLLRCDQEATIHEQKEPLKQSDGSGNVIYFGEKYLTGQYLELRNFNEKWNEYDFTRRTVLVRCGEIFFPQVPTVNLPGKKPRIANDIVLELQLRSSLSN